MDKKKMLIIVPTLHQGGQERVVVRTARLLKEYFDITIAIFDGSDIGYETSDLQLVNLNAPAKPGRLCKAVNILRRARRLKRLKKQLQPYLSYSYGPSANLINSLTQIMSFGTERAYTWVGLRNYTDAVDRFKMNICNKHSDLIVCCAKDIETEVLNRYPDAATAVLYNLYDIEGIKKEAGLSEPDADWYEFMKTGVTQEPGDELIHIMSMGRADDQKMFWHMLKTFRLIHDAIPKARLTILGAGDWDEYKKLAGELEISNSVYFAGAQRNPYRYLKYGQINWMTSRNEGFPNALVEGMALGMAAVSTNCLTGPAEILIEGGDTYSAGEQAAPVYGQYGIVTPELDRVRNMDSAYITDEEHKLAQTMIDLLSDVEKLEKYKRAAACRAEKYSYEAYLKTFVDLAKI